MSENDLSHAECLTALDRVLASGELGTKRMPSLLRYIIEEDVAGRGDRIKAYAIGVDVLERGEDFDPQNDSIVRVEFGRLRKALDSYYLGPGAQDPVRIAVPKGGYRPTFERINVQDAGVGDSGSSQIQPAKWLGIGAVALLVGTLGWKALQPGTETELKSSGAIQQFDGPHVALQAFRATDDSDEAGTLAAGLSAELLTDLWQYPWLSIYMTDSDYIPRMMSGEHSVSPSTDFVISGETRMDDSEVVVRVQVFSTDAMKLQWAATYNKPRDTAEIPAIQSKIALSIAEAIGAANGVMPELVLAGQTQRDNRDFDSLRCVLGIYQYWKSLSAEDHLRKRKCLEETTKRDPGYADAWGALAFIYIDEGRLMKNPRSGADPWADAKRAIEKSLSISSFNGHGLGAAAIYEIAKPNPDVLAFRAYCARLIALRPSNPDVFATCGKHLGENVGDWVEALPMIERAITLTESPPLWYFYSLANHALLHADAKGACSAAERLTTRDSVAAHILQATACAPLKEHEAVSGNLDALASLGVKNVDEAITYIKIRRYEPKLEAALVSGIQEAFAMVDNI